MTRVLVIQVYSYVSTCPRSISGTHVTLNKTQISSSYRKDEFPSFKSTRVLLQSISPFPCKFSNMSDHSSVETYNLESPTGTTATIQTLGARLCSLRYSNREILLPASPSAPALPNPSYIGVPIGRVTNRIKNARLSCHPEIDALAKLEKNDDTKRHHIHGGSNPWHSRIFSVDFVSKTCLKLSMSSPHMDQGYPSDVHVIITYTLTDTDLEISLHTANKGKYATLTNMTVPYAFLPLSLILACILTFLISTQKTHPYFDLTGQEGCALNSVLDYTIEAPLCHHYLPLDSDNIPTGQIAPVENTRFDFRKSRPIHEGSNNFLGYDHYLVASQLQSLEPPLPIQLLTTITSPPGPHGSSFQLQIHSNQPGFQIYTANGFDGSGDQAFAKFGSLAIEPSGFIDAANNSSFPTTSLEPNEERTQIIKYKFCQL